MLWGQRINVYTDHKNLTRDGLGLTSDRLARWRILLEEYAPEIIYINGIQNVKRYLIKLPCSIYIMLHFQKGRRNFFFLFRLLGQSNRAGAINDCYLGILIHSWMHTSLTRPGLADIHFLLDSQR